MEKHYINCDTLSIQRDKLKEIEGEKKTSLFKNKNSIPDGENIKIFQGVLSQNYKKGEVSRNRYKYKQDGWVLDSFARNPLVFLDHDDSYGWIGFVQELYLDTNENLVSIFYVDLDVLDEKKRKQVEKGYISMLSTWAITIEDWYEDKKTWDILSFNEATEKFWFDEVINTLFGSLNTALSYIITKAELVENTLTSIGSNHGAHARAINSMNDEMKKKAEELQNRIHSQKRETTLLTNDLSMSKKDNDVVETDVTTTPEVGAEVETTETPAMEEVVEETPTTEEEVAEVTEAGETLENQVKALTDSLKVLQDKIDAMETKADKKTEREKNRAEILANVPTVTNGTKSEVKTMNDFAKKYFTK